MCLPRPTAAPHRHGVPIVLGTLLLTAGFVAMLIFARNDPIHGRRPVLCQDGPTAAFAQKVARGMTGKPDPFRCRRR